MKRIAILVNKDFEYKGFIEGLRDTVRVYAGTNGRDAECHFDNLIADIYCIQNLFKKDENSSNSEVKYGYLQKLFRSNEFRLEELDGVLSFSTSESTPVSQKLDEYRQSISRNGCVYVGNRFFLSDQQAQDPTTQSHLMLGNSDKIGNTEYYTEKPIHNKLYDFLNITIMDMKYAPINSATKLKCIANYDFTSVGVVNVMDYSCYKKADESAYNISYDSPIGIETTHGVVVKAFDEVRREINTQKCIPVNFISPIVDRYLKFDEDVDGKEGKQNFTCSYNGGVVTGHILKILNDMK